MSKKISRKGTVLGGAGVGGAPVAAADDSGLWTVDRVAADLGVPVDFVHQLRAVECNDSHVTVTRGILVFTAAGVERLRGCVSEHMRQTIEANKAGSDAPREPMPEAAPQPVAEDLRLTRVFPWAGRELRSANVLAERANGLEVVLVVKSAEYLEAGMVLPGCIPGETAWYYMGRLPRSIGQRQLYFPPARRASSHE